MCTSSEGTDNPPWGGGLSVLARRSLLNPPGDKPDTSVGEADLISHRNGDVQITSVHVRPAVDHRDIVGTSSCVAHSKLGAKRQGAVRSTPRRGRHHLPRGRVGSWQRVPRCVPGLGFCLMFGQPDGKQQRYQSAQHGQRQSSHIETPSKRGRLHNSRESSKGAEPFLGGSYILWAIFSPLEADRAESVLSQGLGPRIQPLHTSLFTRVRGRRIQRSSRRTVQFAL